ncbi:unnamed protein product [Closterium sp. Naga37s-1]|nr:unnamed protein product [Closterium sp. Naga37s-1]
MARELKVLRVGSKEAASYPAITFVAGATVELAPDQRKLLGDENHPFTARFFDFVASGRFLAQEVEERVLIVTSNVVADIIAGRDDAVDAFAGVMECRKGSCGNLACLFVFDKIITQLDEVASKGSGPQYPRPNAKIVNALWQEAFRTAKELAFNLSVDMTRPKHDGKAVGNEALKVQKVATGSQIADHGVLALTGGAEAANRGATQEGTYHPAPGDDRVEDDGAEDTAGKGKPQDEAHRTWGRVGEESSEEEAEALEVAAVAASRPTTSGKSIRRLAQQLAPGYGSAGPSGELAEEIMQLDCKLAAQAEQITRLKKRPESRVGGVAVVSYEELASAVAKAVLVLEKEAKAIAGVVVDSMKGAQKKLTDEVSRKIDNMSTAVSATAERPITTSGVTNALHMLITLVSGPSAAAVEPKTEKRGKASKKLPPPPVYTIDEDDADDELENLVSRWVGEAGDGGGQGGKAAVEVHSGGERADE